MALTLPQTAQNIVTKALRSMNAFSSGDPLPAVDANDALDALNDLLDSNSAEGLMPYSQVENIFNLVTGQYQYTIGSYWSTTFSGTLAINSNQITGVVPIPAGTVPGAFLQDLSGAIPANTTILSIVGSTITMSANATATPAVNPTQCQFSVNGQIGQDTVALSPILRPLRITAGFTRITPAGQPSLDYPFKCINVKNYAPLGLKGLPGPWPTRCYYNQQMPLGQLNFYPEPQQAGQVHLFCDTQFSRFPGMTTVVVLPSGWIRYLRFNLACELWPEYYDDPLPEQLKELAFDSKQLLMDLNAEPQAVATYDSDLVRSKRPDASWIMDGGFR